MKLTKAKQKQLDQAYDALIQVCLYDRPLKDMEPYLADDVMNFGAGRKELTKTKAAFLKQIKNQKKLAAGLKMDFRIKPVVRKITNNGNGAIYTDDIVNTVLVNGVKNKLKFRLSFIFEYRGDNWIMLHSHTSTPDSQRTDDEVWPVEELKKRTAVLEKSLDEKIAELEIKNRELEIEAALERVRARTMAMQKSDELREAVRVIYEQLQHLGFDSNACNIIIVDKESGDMQYWVSGFTQQIFPEGYNVPYLSHPYHEELLAASRQNKKYAVMEYSGEMKKRFDDIFFTQTDFRKIPEEAKAFMKALKSVKLSTAFFTYGALQVLGPAEITGERSKILKRFAKVFDLTYTRFLDLQKAEAQARESQIQLALERVRARAMAMQRSDELSEAASLLFQQVQSLGAPSWTAGYCIFDEDKRAITLWMSGPWGDIQPPFRAPLDENPSFINYLEAHNKGLEMYIEENSAKVNEENYQYLLTLPVVGERLNSIIAKGLPLPTYQVDHCAYFSKGFLLFITYQQVPELHSVFKRFAAVFDQTYTRFLDLQKAEAQAREAQIETALERVRSRTMAMHRSEEIADILGKMFEELKRLDMVLVRVLIWIFNHEEKYISWWSANAEVESTANSYRVDYNEHPVFLACLEAWQEKVPLLLYTLSGAEKVSWQDHLFNNTGLSKLPDMVQKGMRSEGTVFTTSAISDYGLLMSGSLEPLSDENTDIIQRFGRVFQQSYTRYLDVQKAEAQARESQIQLALERVRARTMAMQKSDELPEAANLLFLQVQSLGLSAWSAGYCIWDDDKKAITLWMSSEGVIQLPLRMPLTEDPYLMHFLEAHQRGESFFVEEVGGDALVEHYTYLRTLPGVKESLDDIEKAGFPVPTFQIFHLAYFSKGFLLFITYEPVPEAHEIFKRFGKVFDQTYTRFLDLQKAEAQAREAQIEASLERVRASAMAMHHSDELSDVLTVLFEQFDVLNIRPVDVHLDLFDLEKNTFSYRATGKEGKRVIAEQIVEIDSRPEWQSLLERWKKGKPNTVGFSYYPKEVIPVLMTFFPDIWEAMPADSIMSPEDFPDGIYDTLGYCKFGYIGFHHFRNATEEEKNILIRFANEFERLYQRFLDLQKAEAQAREAQIQLALERIRARTMAMHHSSELSDAANLLFDQLRQLGAALWTCGFAICKKDSEIVEKWMGTPEGKMLDPLYIPYTMEQFEQRSYETWKTGGELYTDYLEGVELQKANEIYSSHPSMQKVVNYLNETGTSLPTSLKRHAVSYKYGYLSIITTKPFEEIQIFVRFAKVFDQTYTRFLDLQKAEAQAREAQIEAALERVRTRAMAMHKSDDLKTAVATVFEELDKLNLGLIRCGIAILDKEKPRGDIWITIKSEHSNTIGVSGDEPLDIHPLLKGAYDAWQRQEDFSYALQNDDLTSYYRAITKTNFLQPVYATFTNEQKDQPQYYFNAVFQDGSLFAFLNTDFTDEAKTVMKRFANVFNLTYKRFLDLQKAEAQAREAQIEVSLERVRSKTMAMHNSQDVGDTVATMFDELVKLGVETVRCGVGIMHEPNQMELWTAKKSENKKAELIIGRLDMTIHPLLQGMYNGWKNKDITFSYDLKGKDLVDYFTVLINSPEYHINYDIASLPQQQFQNGFYFSEGALFAFSAEQLSAEAFQIFKRFAGVFGQTYRRYLDLQKAEANAREARIEAALEKVRSRSLAMHKSDELQEVVNTVFERLKELNIEMDSANIAIFKEGTKDLDYWIASPVQNRSESFHLPYFDFTVIKDLFIARETGVKFFGKTYSFEEKNEWFAHAFMHSDFKFLTEDRKAFIFNAPAYTLSIAFAKNTGVQVNRYSEKLLSDEEIEVLKRFAKVFEQAYIRFLDLQKAEAQAREAQIESALERIRAKALAMQNSNDLFAVAETLWIQLKKLGQPELESSIIHLYNNGMENFDAWYTYRPPNHPTGEMIMGFAKVSPTSTEWAREVITMYQSPATEYTIVSSGEKLAEWYKEVARLAPATVDYNENGQMIIPEILYYHFSNFSGGSLLMISNKEPSPEACDLHKRAAAVFDLAYTRFLDLQKAEAQAREAQIEAALERVRSKTMAMHNSQDVGETVATMLDELVKLGIQTLRCGVGILHEGYQMELWTAIPEANGKVQLVIGNLDMKLHPLLTGGYDTWKAKQEHFLYELKGNDLTEYFNAINNYPGYPVKYDMSSLPPVIFHNEFHFNEGTLFVFSLDQLPAETSQVFKRFAAVFGQTYRRYLDLKRAEAQATEAKIEAALERVRGKAMAMHSSQDLAATIGVFYHELQTFSITPRRCGVGLLNKETRLAELSTMNTTGEGESIEIIGTLRMEGHPVLEGVFDNWLLQKEYHPVLRGNEIREYYQLLRPQIPFPDYPNDAVQYGYFFFFNEGGVYAWTEKEMNEDELQIYRRFTTVLSLTYKRYIDLTQAEASAKDAVKQAALDRIRADIASMRTISDLDRITPLIWNELTILGVPFIRCGVFIMDNSQQLIHTFLSTPDGKAIGAFHLPYVTPGNISQVLHHWRNNNNYIDHWDESSFTELAGILVKQGAIATPEQYLSTIPPGGFYLHFLPFMQGMLYVGNTTQLPEDEIRLIQSVADAFSTAYARYEDFNKLEAAKQQVDQTLTDLKQAQTQLVQSEKMASLGELTAGIAHEIQNPLNFVNNFSDVSNELLEEMKGELATGNMQQAIAIADDVRQNLEKILHHGKRADEIVKGMLQHSRTSSGQKEPTDINALAEEYLRLSYHGLRAKEKSFNAKFETDFDNNIGKINIIPQEIGRVILNLINNAFYAVSEKKKQGSVGYEPAVTVSTRKTIDKILISVTDNGIGIPEGTRDKIFQPFFTTKPTGQGTGLGLSLAYDIIKAHGGDLKVETKEGEGSEFIIQLPVN